MSAFFCSDEVLDKVVTAILKHVDSFGDIQTYRQSGRLHKEIGTKIGSHLRTMNAEALRQRYGDKFTQEDLSYKFKKFSTAPKIHQLKAMQCLQYQCCEGNVPETNRFYIELSKAMGEVALLIVEDLPEYERAPWG